MVTDIGPGDHFTNLNDLTSFLHSVYFAADDGEGGSELWKTNGTEQGTVLVRDINAGFSGSYPHDLLGDGKSLFLAAYSRNLRAGTLAK